MEFTISQQIYYSNRKLVPIKDVAESLLALEAILRQTPQILESFFPGTKIQQVDIFINELQSGSIYEDIFVKFVFGDQQKFDAFIEGSREKLGMEFLMNNPKLLSAIVLAIIFGGGLYFLNKDPAAKPEQRAAIEANNNTIIQIGSGMLEIKPEHFKAIIEAATKDKEVVAKNAIKIVNPAKLDPEASITFSHDPELQIKNEAVKAMPKYIPESEDDEYIEDFKSIELEVRAIDLDSTKRGWAVVAPEIHKKRVRLQIDPSVDPVELSNIRKLKADVTVIFGFDREGNKIPKLIFLRKIIKI